MAEPYSMRRAAYRAVRGWAEKGWRIETSISRIRQSQGLDVRDVAAATDIAALVIKRLASLDVVLDAYCSRSRGKVEVELWTLAQVGAAQLLFRRDMPPHAVVHETVNVADEIGKPQWKGFLNGLLRSVVRAVRFQDEVSFVDGLQAVATQSFEAGSWAVFDKPLVDGGPQDSEWLSRVYSLPRWCTRRWLQASSIDQLSLEQFLRGCNETRCQWIRVNLRRQSREALVEQFRSALSRDVVVESGSLPESVSLVGPVALSQLPGFDQGSCSVQDLTAMAAVDRLAPLPNEQILDLCAAPGGKTGFIAERLNGSGLVVAADTSESRLERVAENVDRLDLSNVEIVRTDRDGQGLDDRSFDAAMVDVPCSNTGVLAKRPEARWRIREQDIAELAELQQELLGRAATLVRAGGRMVYSTCSVEPEENRQVIDEFLVSHDDWSLTVDALSLPGGPADGGYHALLERTP